MTAFFLYVVVGIFAASQLVASAPPSAVQPLRSPQRATKELYPSLDERQSRKRSAFRSKYTIPNFSNPKATNYHVNSSALPLVKFTLQDSWAGQLPISADRSETRKLFFWYWPSSAKNGSDSLTIWLNGGPGCSSLVGFLEENGPFLYAKGSTAPVLNKYGWTTASDMLYIEQPIGTGFTTGTSNLTNESTLADEFYGFLQQFYSIFSELSGRKLFITGESYAGFYIPYIATRIVDATAAEKTALPLNLQALLINDGVYSSFITSFMIPAARFAVSHQAVMNLTNEEVSTLTSQATSCGYDAVWAQVTYPPKGKIPLPNGGNDIVAPGCELNAELRFYAQQQNPCFNVNRVTDKCPTPNDPIEPYFSRPDVQRLIHVPNFGNWSECSNKPVFNDDIDLSPYTETLFPHLLSTLPRGITLWHGLNDANLMSEGDRITIQNLTWGGLQGFQTPITTSLTVNGIVVGVWHSERNLTYLEIANAGHMIPEDQPVTALHVFNWVLGKGAL